MNLEFPHDLREYTYSRRDFFWRNLKRRVPFILLLVWGFLLIFSWSNFSLKLFLLAGSCGSIIGLLFYAWLIRFYLYNSKAFDLPHKFAFDANYLYFTTPLTESRYQWEMFNGFNEDRRFLGLLTAQGLVSLPKILWSEDELEAIRHNLRSKAKPRKIWIRHYQLKSNSVEPGQTDN